MKHARLRASLFGCGLMLALSIPARAQVSGGNLLIGQAGKVIVAERKDRSDLYDRLDPPWARGVQEGYAAGRGGLAGTSSLALTVQARSPAARERSPHS